MLILLKIRTHLSNYYRMLKIRHLPVWKIKFNKYKHKKNKWITRGILKSIKTKNILYKVLRQTDTEDVEASQRLKKPTTFNNSRYTTNITTDPCTVTTADIKANMRDIHTSIVSQHLAARDNKKILHTHPPQVSSTEENLPWHTRHTLAQLRTNKSPFLLSYLHKIDASTHPSPLCPLCRIHEHTT